MAYVGGASDYRATIGQRLSATIQRLLRGKAEKFDFQTLQKDFRNRVRNCSGIFQKSDGFGGRQSTLSRGGFGRLRSASVGGQLAGHGGDLMPGTWAASRGCLRVRLRVAWAYRRANASVGRVDALCGAFVAWGRYLCPLTQKRLTARFRGVVGRWAVYRVSGGRVRLPLWGAWRGCRARKSPAVGIRQGKRKTAPCGAAVRATSGALRRSSRRAVAVARSGRSSGITSPAGRGGHQMVSIASA